MLEFIFGAALLFLALCAVSCWVFVFRHALTAWYDNPGGRYLMASKVTWGGMFTMTLMGQLIPLKPLTAAVISALTFAWTFSVLVVLLRLQHREIREAKQDAARERDRLRSLGR